MEEAGSASFLPAEVWRTTYEERLHLSRAAAPKAISMPRLSDNSPVRCRGGAAALVAALAWFGIAGWLGYGVPMRLR
jgi:hypothetical protein